MRSIFVIFVYLSNIYPFFLCITYNSIEFLENNEICVRGDYACELFTTHSIKKFSYTFDKEVYKILSGENGENYTFIFKDTIDEVKLK